MKHIAPFAAAVFACAVGTEHAAAQPAITFTQPQAVRLGEATEITLHGDKFEEPLSVWANFPGQVDVVRELDEAGQPKPNPDPKTLCLRVTAAQDQAVSVGGIVVGNKAGVSETALLLVDDLPSAAEAGNNHSLKEAQEIPPLIAVDGVGDGAAFDYFRFAATAGQRVAVEVVAQRLGSSFDPVVRLLDAEGKELLFVDDDAALGADCRFAHTFAQEGQYVLEVRDVQYRAGGRYRLRVGDFPVVDAAYPLAGPRGAATEFHFSGPDGATAAAATVTIPADAPNQVGVSARLPNGQSSGMVTVAASALSNTLEVEPNDTPEAAQEISLPTAVNGQIQTPGDHDSYRFAAKKDEKYLIRGLSRTLGSPAYLFLRLFDEKGAKLAETGAANDVESLTFAVPADGVYRLEVEDLLHAGGPGFAYRVEIEPVKPQFSLLLKNDKNTPHKFLSHADGAFALDLQVDRQGYEGPIELSLQAPREGFQLRQATLPAGAKEGRLLVLAPADWTEGELLALRVTGAAADGQAQTPVSTAALLRTKRPELLTVPAWLDGVIFASAGAPPEPFFALNLSEETVAFDRTKNEAKFIFTLERKNKDYKADPLLLVENLPAGATAAVKKEAKDQAEQFEVTISGAEIPAGEHAFQVLAYGDFGGRGIKQVAAPKLRVE